MTAFERNGEKFIRQAGSNKLVKVETKGGTGVAARMREAKKTKSPPVVSTHMLNDMAEQHSLFAFYTVRDIKDRAVASDTVLTKYTRICAAYEAWQLRQSLAGKDVLIHLPTEMAALGLLARFLDIHAQRMDAGDKGAYRDQMIKGAKPCDHLMSHMINASAAIADQGECGLTIGEKTALLHPSNVNFITRTALRNCCFEPIVNQFGRAIQVVMPDFVPLEPERVRSHLRPAESLSAFKRESRCG